MAKLTVGVLTLCLWTSSVLAADATIFGLALGRPVALPPCQSMTIGASKAYPSIPARTCITDAGALGHPERTIVFSQSERPPMISNGRVLAIESDGNLVGIRMVTPGAMVQGAVVQQLSTKYGPPTENSGAPAKDVTGEPYVATTAKWRNGPVDVTYYGVMGPSAQGQLTIELAAYSAQRLAGDFGPSPSGRKL